ncbi:MAG TPA: spore coat protein [Clostridia bacterium]|nr:spore coat protein [Clostridia bacterium]
MNNLTTRELLYLEDASKIFESIVKNCNFAANSSNDPEFKNLVQSMAQEHKQWITSTASIVNNNNLQ